jgi:hypothetical protein
MDESYYAPSRQLLRIVSAPQGAAMAGGGELSVNYDALEDLGTVLDGLKDEFDGMRDHMEQYRDHAGHDGVRDKMKRVGKNWSDDRKKIVARMEEVSAFAVAAAEAYRETDRELANEFTGALEGG